MQARRTVALALSAGVGAVLMAGGAVMADSESMEFTLVERATTDVVIDIGEPGDTLGDMLAFGNDLYDADNANVVGRDQGQCFRTNPGLSWECTFTNILEDGSITVQGPFYDDLRDVDMAITGGTGAYTGASGTMILHARDELGTELEFIFHVSGDDDSDHGDDDDSDDDASDDSDDDDSDDGESDD